MDVDIDELIKQGERLLYEQKENSINKLITFIGVLNNYKVNKPQSRRTSFIKSPKPIV